MIDQPIVRISATDLDVLLGSLDVKFVALSQCLVSKGYRLDLGGAPAPGIHYNLKGYGKAYVGNNPPIDLVPHTLIVVPVGCPLKIEVAENGRSTPVNSATVMQTITTDEGSVKRFVAGDGSPEIALVCGFFWASYGSAVDLFETLSAEIVEVFSETDRLDSKLTMALAELVAQQVGHAAMSAALLKQVIVAILRRSLKSTNLWVERFSMLSDPQVAKAFADMAANPGAPHTTKSLAETACLSRSAFMDRFAETVGHPPMTVLRSLRMRQACLQLQVEHLTIDEIAHSCGYESRSSFIRAFGKAMGADPSEFREQLKLRSAPDKP